MAFGYPRHAPSVTAGDGLIPPTRREGDRSKVDMSKLDIAEKLPQPGQLEDMVRRQNPIRNVFPYSVDFV
jgi:hypothetical protein